MTTVLTIEHLKFKINERDHNPPHLHVEAHGVSIRINLLTLEIMGSTEFSKSMVKKILLIVQENQDFFLSEWSNRHG